MADADFRSGPWTGYYLYPNGKRGEMDLALRFESGRMSGTGHDELGHFRIEGNYDTTSQEANWNKAYPDGHTVCYRGFRENPVKGIWGTWNIPNNWSGGFHIWPRDSDRETFKNLAEKDKKKIVRFLEEASATKLKS
jgi:hypothetical protein